MVVRVEGWSAKARVRCLHPTTGTSDRTRVKLRRGVDELRILRLLAYQLRTRHVISCAKITSARICFLSPAIGMEQPGRVPRQVN